MDVYTSARAHAHTLCERNQGTKAKANVDGHTQADTRLWLQKHLIRPTKQEESCG